MKTIIAKSFYQGLPGAKGFDSLNIKPQLSCRVVAIGNIAPSGLSEIDNRQLVAGNRVLLTAQTVATQNGVWIAATGAWSRPIDYVIPTLGFSYTILEGDLNGSSNFVLLTEGTIIVDVTPTQWTEYSVSPIRGSGATFGDDETALSVNDNQNRTAFAVNLDGSISLAATNHQAVNLVPSANDTLEIVDGNGNRAIVIEQDGTLKTAKLNLSNFEIDSTGLGFSISDGINDAFRIDLDGTVKIGKLETGESESGSGENQPAAWNESNSFWQGFAPTTGATSSYDRVFPGSATSAVADDFAMRQCYFSQFAGKSIRAYFDHSSDHVSTYYPNIAWTSGNMFVSWGAGLSGSNSPIAGASPDIKRGTIQGERRKKVPYNFYGWSDELALDVPKNQYLCVQTAQNIQGSFRLSGGAGATGLVQGAARSGGFLIPLASRWSRNISTPPLVLNDSTYDLDGCAGIRFVAVKTPIDIMIAIASDSIGRGIYYTDLPAPSNWASLLNRDLSAAGKRAAVWAQGSGGGTAGAMSINERWLNRISNCTHLIITLGANDLNGGDTVTNLQANVTAIADHAKEFGAKVFVATVIPWNAYTASQNTNRNNYNAWVRTNPFDGFFDFDSVCATPGNSNIMLAAYDGGDGIHPNTAGHTAMLATIPLSVFY